MIREIASRAIAVYREVRPRARALTDEQLAATLAEEFRRKQLRSDDLLAELGKRRIADG